MNSAGAPAGWRAFVHNLHQSRVERGLPVEVDTDETTNRLAVIDRTLNAFVRQAKALLGHVHAQHACQANRRTASTLDLRIKRFNLLMQLAPRRGIVDLRKKAVAPRQLLLVGILEVGEALLHYRQNWVG